MDLTTSLPNPRLPLSTGTEAIEIACELLRSWAPDGTSMAAQWLVHDREDDPETFAARASCFALVFTEAIQRFHYRSWIRFIEARTTPLLVPDDHDRLPTRFRLDRPVLEAGSLLCSRQTPDAVESLNLARQCRGFMNVEKPSSLQLAVRASIRMAFWAAAPSEGSHNDPRRNARRAVGEIDGLPTSYRADLAPNFESKQPPRPLLDLVQSILSPVDTAGVLGVFTPDLWSRFWSVYRPAALSMLDDESRRMGETHGDQAFDLAESIRGRAGSGELVASWGELCQTMIALGVFSSTIRSYICPSPPPRHRLACAALLDNLIEMGTLARLLQNAITILSQPALYASQFTVSPIPPNFEPIPSTTMLPLRALSSAVESNELADFRSIVEQAATWQESARRASWTHAVDSFESLRTRLARFEQLIATSADPRAVSVSLLHDLLNDLQDLDSLLPGKAERQRDTPALHPGPSAMVSQVDMTRRKLLDFLSRTNGVQVYNIKPGESIKAHFGNCDVESTSNVPGPEGRILAVRSPGYTLAGESRPTRKAKVQVSR